MFRKVIFSAFLALSFFKLETGVAQGAFVNVETETTNAHCKVIYDDGAPMAYLGRNVTLLKGLGSDALGIAELRNTKSIMKPMGDYTTYDNYIFDQGHIFLHGGHLKSWSGVYIYSDYDGNSSGIGKRFHFMQYDQSAMTIDENGNVGIGTNIFGFSAGSTASRLVVHNNNNKNRHLLLAGSAPGIMLADGSYTEIGGLALVKDNGDFVANSVSNDIILRNKTGSLLFSTNNQVKLRIGTSGNVSIGIHTASEKLHVYGGNVKIESTGYPNLQLYNGTSNWTIQHSSSYNSNQLQFRYDGTTRFRLNGPDGFIGVDTDDIKDKLTLANGMLRVVGTNTPSAATEEKGILRMGSNTNSSGPYTSYSWIQSGIKSGQGSLLLLNPVDGSGAVAINHNPHTATYPFPSGYALYVRGKVLCEELKVQYCGSWSDYVFDEDYKLRSLDSVEAFIKENKHLPEVPSAKEIEKEGINTGEMDAILLKKIEELTLYMIEQKKEIEALKKKNEELERKLK